MKSIERIFQYLECKGLTKQELERISGISNGYLAKQFSRKADIGESILKKVLENCPDINPLWLILGEEPMLKNDTHIYNVSSPSREPAALPTINEPHHCVYREMYEKEKEEVKSLNREIGSLNREIGELKAELRAEKKAPYVSSPFGNQRGAVRPTVVKDEMYVT